jgi:hypothetical protein
MRYFVQLGPVIDETGEVSSGKLILSDQAWEQLLGRTAEQLVSTSVDVLQYLEQRLLLLRVTMGFALRLDDVVCQELRRIKSTSRVRSSRYVQHAITDYNKR